MGLRSRLSFEGRDLPAEYWFLWLGTVINRLGGFVVPFLMLYLTARLQIAPATAALMVSVLGAGSFISQLTGGELADRIGRRPVMLFSFFASSLAMLTMGLVQEPAVLVLAMFALGFCSDLSRPAINAAIVDLVPAEKRTRAFGYLYWAINLGAALAPIVAGLLANVDYFLLFVGDALTTAVFGVIVLLRIAESRPERTGTGEQAGLLPRARHVARDPLMLVFALLAFLFAVVYSQSHVTLPLAMAADGLPPSDYGLAIAVNGALIVLITLRALRVIERWPRFPALALAALLLGSGFGMTALADTLPFYALTVVIWTLGEIVGAVAPVVVSEMSPSDMRGLYQGIFGSMWGLAFFVGPIVGGLVFQELGEVALWTGAFAIGIVLAISYLLLGVLARNRLHAVEAEQPIG